MRLTALIWNRYRSFKERQRVELAPTTIVIGRNGSGKSIVARLPLLLSGAIASDAQGPIDLTAGGIDHAASYQDLVNMRGALPFSLGLEVTGQAGTFGFETTLRHVNETRSLAIEHFVLSRDGSAFLTAEISNIDELTNTAPTYLIRLEDTEAICLSIDFAGLLPKITSFASPVREQLQTIFTHFREALSKPSYLGPFRAEPGRVPRSPNQGIRDLGPRGERAIELLADDKLRHGGELSGQVSEWFANALGQGLTLDVTGDHPQLRVADPMTHFDVELADTGAGFSQVLPVVVQHYGYRAGRIGSPILIVEQPELHLHPAAHGDVADLIVSTSTRGDSWRPATCIVETHSEQFIMRVRRRIAEGLDCRNAILWSLQHIGSSPFEDMPEPLHVIQFDSSGDPSAWPAGVFEEALNDLSAMRQAVRERGL